MFAEVFDDKVKQLKGTTDWLIQQWRVNGMDSSWEHPPNKAIEAS